jgi:hypothetical protein
MNYYPAPNSTKTASGFLRAGDAAFEGVGSCLV